MPRPSSKRAQLVDTALALFNEGGYHATGIDRILAEAGVARMTLYNHFPSKDALVLAVLEQRRKELSGFLLGYVDAHAGDGGPRARVLAYFDALGVWFSGRALPGRPFRGCMFINAAAEFAIDAAPVRQAVADAKRQTRRWFRDRAAEAGAADPDALARQLTVLAEGATVTAQMLGEADAARDAKAAAAALLDLARKEGSCAG